MLLAHQELQVAGACFSFLKRAARAMTWRKRTNSDKSGRIYCCEGRLLSENLHEAASQPD